MFFVLESTQLKHEIAFANYNLHWKWKLRVGLKAKQSKATNNFSKIHNHHLVARLIICDNL
jgi:hypothetical protein